MFERLWLAQLLWQLTWSVNPGQLNKPTGYNNPNNRWIWRWDEWTALNLHPSTHQDDRIQFNAISAKPEAFNLSTGEKSLGSFDTGPLQWRHNAPHCPLKSSVISRWAVALEWTFRKPDRLSFSTDQHLITLNNWIFVSSDGQENILRSQRD